MGQGGLFNKAAIRITVEVSPHDEKSVSWADLTAKYGMDDVTFRRLDRAGGGGARNWWVHRGVVRPEAFVAMDFLDGGVVRPEEESFLEIIRRSSGREEALKEIGAFRVGSGMVVRNLDVQARPGSMPPSTTPASVV